VVSGDGVAPANATNAPCSGVRARRYRTRDGTECIINDATRRQRARAPCCSLARVRTCQRSAASRRCRSQSARVRSNTLAQHYARTTTHHQHALVDAGEPAHAHAIVVGQCERTRVAAVDLRISPECNRNAHTASERTKYTSAHTSHLSPRATHCVETARARSPAQRSPLSPVVLLCWRLSARGSSASQLVVVVQSVTTVITPDDVCTVHNNSTHSTHLSQEVDVGLQFVHYNIDTSQCACKHTQHLT
jgi:hypothetical protein